MSEILTHNRRSEEPFATLSEGYSYRTLARALLEAGIGDEETCRFEAGVLVQHFCGVHRAMLPLRRDEIFRGEVFLAAVKRRLLHEPLQYIVGEWQFCTETYTVTPDCLIPRMDTEILVEAADALLPENGRFIDLCTGSGCIAISLLAARPDASGVAVELYEPTLALARQNAERNGVADRLGFHRADVLNPVFMEDLGTYDLILSNPPYIPSATVDTLSKEVLCEPRVALDGGADGFDFYRVLLSAYPRYLKPGGYMILEIGSDQGDAMKHLAKQHGLFCEIRQDLSALDRIAILSYGRENL